MRQGRTDAWIAHQLEVTVQQIQAFKREQDLDANGGEPATEEVDLRAEDDAAIAVELEEEAKRREEEEAAEAARKAEEEAREAEEAARRAAEAEGEATRRTTRSPSAPPAAPAVAAAGAAAPRARSRAPSITATRATACGSTPPCRTTRRTPSTGRATGPSRSRSKRTRS